MRGTGLKSKTLPKFPTNSDVLAAVFQNPQKSGDDDLPGHLERL
jgi:hypothetical protein